MPARRDGETHRKARNSDEGNKKKKKRKRNHQGKPRRCAYKFAPGTRVLFASGYMWAVDCFQRSVVVYIFLDLFSLSTLLLGAIFSLGRFSVIIQRETSFTRFSNVFHFFVVFYSFSKIIKVRFLLGIHFFSLLLLWNIKCSWYICSFCRKFHFFFNEFYSLQFLAIVKLRIVCCSSP